jgi:hypothetical protein
MIVEDTTGWQFYEDRAEVVHYASRFRPGNPLEIMEKHSIRRIEMMEAHFSFKRLWVSTLTTMIAIYSFKAK